MNPEKVGNLIKTIRKKNNLSQQQFAARYGVTYQAVSKWETGKNIPDILLLKQICNDFGFSIDDFLEGKEKEIKKEKNVNLKFIFIIIGLLICFVFFLIKVLISDDGFKFKTLNASCDNFVVSGSVAYNENKSSIYISNIDYCGNEDTNKYASIKCSLYEEINDSKVLVTSCSIGEDLTLDEFLKDLKLGANDYKQNCKNFVNNKLCLEISATDYSGKVTLFEVPLLLEDNCKF